MDRRTFLYSSGAVAAGGVLAGCLDVLAGGSGEVPEPIDLSGGKLDYQGGMEIGRHGGPNGQIFYDGREADTVHGANQGTDGQDGLAWFHTLAQGLFPYHFERLDRGWEPAVVYATDYSAVEYDAGGDPPRMPSPTGAETFADVEDLRFVGGSEARGGMGPDLFPFSDSEEASDFAAEHGGDLFSFGEINRSLLASLLDGGDVN
jgi:nitrous oxide reductase accessory protein NosL